MTPQQWLGAAFLVAAGIITLLAAGIPLNEVQAMGGWSRASMLLDVYSHSLPQNLKAAGEWWSEQLQATKEETG